MAQMHHRPLLAIAGLVAITLGCGARAKAPQSAGPTAPDHAAPASAPPAAAASDAGQTGRNASGPRK